MSTSSASHPTDVIRVPAPDLARGMMLLLIALANIPWFVWTGAVGPFSMHPPARSASDAVVQFIMITAVDMRVYPMFAFLFGYGMVQFVRARLARGLHEREARRRLRRRHLALLAIGAAHAAFLFTGDILGTYGCSALLLVALLFGRSDRELITVAALLSGTLALLSILAVTSSSFIRWAAGAESTSDAPVTSSFAPGVTEASYLASIGNRLTFWLEATLANAVFLVIPACVLLGWIAARRGILERPEAHLGILATTAMIGVTVGVVGGLPAAAHHAGLIELPAVVAGGYQFVHMTTGLAAGVGYVAVFALLARARAGRSTRLGRSVSALGRASLSGYLAQSVVFAPLMCAWGLGLGQYTSSTVAALIAAVTWTLTLFAATVLDQRGRRGPAEAALRRVIDGRPRAASSAA